MLIPRAWIPVLALFLSLLATGCSKSTSSEPSGVTPAPLKAYGLTASAADRTATLSWPSINGASAYNLYWSTSADVSLASASKITGVSAPYTHSGLSNGTAYHYLFTAVTAVGESTPSNTVKVTPKLPRDGAPTKVSTFAGDGRITLTWAAVPNATTYSVYWNTSGDVTLNDIKVENITYPAVHTSLINGQQYYYTVTATTPTFGEVASAEVSTAPHIAAPSPPLSVSVSAGDQRANLSWPPVSDATSYALYWNSTGQVSLADAHIEVSTPNYAHSGLTNNARYYYRVAALNTQGLSVLSAEVTAKPHAPAPGAPSNVTATASNERITLNWDAVANASQYNLYWDTGAAVTVIANVKPPFVHQPLSGGVPVYYTVTALRDGVESASSGQISAMPLGPLPPAPVPLAPRAAKKQVTLAWTAVDQALSYRVYWHTQANATETIIITTSPSYTHTGLLDSTTYYYRIEAITPDGISPSSEEINATTLAAVAPETTGPPPTFTIGGSINGLTNSSTGLVLTLTNDSSKTLVETLPIAAGATVPFAFKVGLESGGTYTVSVSASPNTPISQTCSVTAGTGTITIGTLSITSVRINCSPNSFAVGGSVNGLVTGESVGLSLVTSATQMATVTAPATSYTFGTVLSGTTYTLAISSKPSGKTCTFVKSGAINLSDVIVNLPVDAIVNCGTNSTPTFMVTASAGTGGSITPTSVSVTQGASTVLNVTPNSGFGIASVTATGCTGTLVGTIYTTGAITAACAVSASFSLNSYTVTATASANGTITPASSSVTHGATTNFTVTPTTGYSASVTGCGGTLVGTTYTTGAITANCAVTASFAAVTFTVTATSGANGSITPSGNISVIQGGTTSFTVTPATGFIASVSGCGGTLVGNIYKTGPITANCPVTASFGLSSYVVTATAGANGTISPGSATVVQGATTLFTVSPTTGYSASVSGCGGTLVGNTYTTGAITAACAVSASFTLNSYVVTATASANGTITPASSSVNHGATTSFTVTPTTGYSASVSGCGGALVGNLYTTGAITGACTVTANFLATSFAVSVVVSGLTSSGLVLQKDLGETLTIGTVGTYAFVAQVPTGSTYSLAITANPTGQSCLFSNGTGATTGDVTNIPVAVTCKANPTYTSKLNDTGVTANQCFQAGNNVLVACNSAAAIALNPAQDGMIGRDVGATNGNTDGKLGFSFSSVSGGCVQDNNTGLMWEVKTTDGGLRDWTKRYSNYSAVYNPVGLYGTATDASGFVTAVNAATLCTFSDWRLPTRDELQSIEDYGVAIPGPTVDATWFPNTQGYGFWSASNVAGFTGYAWIVSFAEGNVLYNGRSYAYNVRLVRAGQ